MVLFDPAAILPAIVPLTVFLLYRQLDNSVTVSRDTWDQEYDYIVVGGGSGGNVVASRLSEDPSRKVLLLEAGGSDNVYTDVPLGAITVQHTAIDWAYQTESQEASCFGLKGRRSRWPRGKVLGGSSVLNFMLYIRGNRNDYDRWEALGNKNWGYRHVFPYFLKAEDNQDPHYAYSGYHNRGGPLTVETPPNPTEIAKAFLVAGQQVGYPITDNNGARQTGFMFPQGTTRRGGRCSTSKAYLQPARKRKNLHVVTFSHVTKVNIDPLHKKVIGVNFNRLGIDYSVRVRREVIVSGGSINSPQLLMLSGIGPCEHLAAHGITCIHHLPGVGENLQDHIYSGGLHFNVDAKISLVQRRHNTPANVIRFLLEGSGTITSLGAVEGLAFLNTKFANKSIDWPDMQFHLLAGGPTTDDGLGIRKVMGISDQVWDTIYKPNLPYDSFSIYPTLLRPESRGCIRLKSKDPFTPPAIDPRYLTKPKDIQVMVDGMKLGIQTALAPAYQVWGSRMYSQVWPGCEKYYKHVSNPLHLPDEYLACIARTYTATIYHPVGTCKMGPATDPMAVLDSKLRVRGIHGLRVCDASVMPYIVSGNTNAPTIMIGERCADFIKGVSLPPIDPPFKGTIPNG